MALAIQWCMALAAYHTPEPDIRLWRMVSRQSHTPLNRQCHTNTVFIYARTCYQALTIRWL